MARIFIRFAFYCMRELKKCQQYTMKTLYFGESFLYIRRMTFDLKTIILVPTYNERKNIPVLLEKIAAKITADVLIIDDNSPDKTGALADEMRSKYPFLNVMRRPYKQGLGMAYKDGFKWALARDYQAIIMMDADLSHDPSALPLFVEKIKTHDAVFGSRYLRGVRVYNWSFKRLLLSKLSNKFIEKMLNIQSSDTTTAFKCFRRQVIEEVDVSRIPGRQNAFFIELVFKTIKAGYKTTEIPFLFIEREEGESKMRFSVAVESLLVVFKLFFFRFRGKKSRHKSFSLIN
jgi:dolichol-phosphate mannosyltransferase